MGGPAKYFIEHYEEDVFNTIDMLLRKGEIERAHTIFTQFAKVIENIYKLSAMIDEVGDIFK